MKNNILKFTKSGKVVTGVYTCSVCGRDFAQFNGSQYEYTLENVTRADWCYVIGNKYYCVGGILHNKDCQQFFKINPLKYIDVDE